ILLPSATVAQSNIPVQEGDEHVSFTQFTVGGLFSFMDYGFKMEAGLATEDPEEYKQVMEQRGLRLKEGLGLFCTKELVAPAE
ncbi:hypothetical protein B0H14DRAFT_2334172, partial [Mycena olivaceomarginata]